MISIRTDAVETTMVAVQLNGQLYRSVVQADLIFNGSHQTSRFELTISTINDAINYSWLSPTSGMLNVTILVRSSKNSADVPMFEGLADDITFDPLNRMVRIQGRDYSSVLINSSYQHSFCNQTASEIVEEIANRHGFLSDIAATSTMAGSYRCGSYNQFLLNAHSRVSSEWDLLLSLASVEGYDVFVSGKTLVFAAPGTLPGKSILLGQADIKSVKISRRCPLSNQTRIVVKSWNSWLNQTLSNTTQQSPAQTLFAWAALGTDPGTEIAIIQPNLTSQGTERLAQQCRDTLNKNALSIELVMAGELSLRPRDVIAIGESIGDFTDEYVVASVHRHFSPTSGFTQYIHGLSTTANQG